MIMTLLEFLRSIYDKHYFFWLRDEKGPYAYDADAALEGWDPTDESLNNQVVVLWNTAGTIALVSLRDKADPDCSVIKAQSEIYK